MAYVVGPNGALVPADRKHGWPLATATPATCDSLASSVTGTRRRAAPARRGTLICNSTSRSLHASSASSFECAASGRRSTDSGHNTAARTPRPATPAELLPEDASLVSRDESAHDAGAPPKLGPIEINDLILKARDDPDELRAVVAKFSYRFNAVNLSTAAYNLGKAAKRAGAGGVDSAFTAEFGLLRRRLLQLPVESVSARAVASLAYGAALAAYDDRVLLSRIQLIALGQIEAFSPQGISNLLWALASLGAPRSRIFDATLEHWTPRMRQFKPQEAVCLIWAFVKIGCHDDVLQQAIVDSFRFRIGMLNPQDVTLLCWALAKGGFVHRGFLSDLTAHIRKILPRFRPASIPSVLLSLSSTGYTERDFFQQAALQAVPTLGQLTPQQLANLLSALARAGYDEAVVVDAIAAEIDLRLSHPEPPAAAAPGAPRRALDDVEALATIAFALGTLRHRSPALFNKIGRAVLPRLPGATDQQLGMIAFAVSVVRFYEPQLAAGLMAEGEFRGAAALGPLVLTRLVLCAASLRLGESARPLLEAVVAAAGEAALAEEANYVRLLLSTAYALLVLEMPDLLRPVLMRLAEAYGRRPADFSELQLRHLYSVLVALHVEQPSLCQLLPSALVRRVHALHEAQQAPAAPAYQPPTAWTAEESVWPDGEETSRMGAWREELAGLLPRGARENVRVPAGGPGGGPSFEVVVDFALEPRTALILHGPLRTLSKAHGPVPDGRTHLRVRLLHRLGWSVSLLSFAVWQRTPASERGDLLRNLVAHPSS